MVPIDPMRPKNIKSGTESDQADAVDVLQPTRRDIVRCGGALFSASLVGSGLLPSATLAATELEPVALALGPSKLALRSGAPESAVALCQPASIGPIPLADALNIRLHNALDNPVAMTLRGNSALLNSTPSIKPGGEDIVRSLACTYPGTPLLAEFTSPDPLCVAALVVPESSPSTADRDEIVLIEEWRVRADETLVQPGSDPGDASAVFTLNRRLTPKIAVRRFEQGRFRSINASPRSLIALRGENQNAQVAQGMRVMANDSRPAEPFPALNGQVALSPGARLDAFIDMSGETGSTATLLLHDGVTARPLAKLVYGSEAMRNALLAEPAPLTERPSLRPILRDAQRFELVYDGSAGDGLPPTPPPPNGRPGVTIELELIQRAEQLKAQPMQRPEEPKQIAEPTALLPQPKNAFTAMRGRTVSFALIHWKSPKPAIFHLRNHHARLLDRLDDGWKPYWVDTIPIDAGQTQRVAFVPENAGSFTIEAFAPEWSSQLWRRGFNVVFGT